MKKGFYRLAFAFLLLLSAAITGLLLVNFTSANFMDRQYLPELTIESDGTITGRQALYPRDEIPILGLINRTGNIYTLTTNIEEYSMKIECSNIVFDGSGHTIHASGAFTNSGLRILLATNVTVKNLEVIGKNPTSIFLASSNCLITNVKTQEALRINGEFNNVTKSNIGRLILWHGDNFISKCNLSMTFVNDFSRNVLTKNIFLFDNSTDEFSIKLYSANSWDDGSVGNYWSDYIVKYPNASEIGNTGIGDTPYIIDQNNIDHYPLMYPYDIEKDAIALPTPEPLIELQTGPLPTPLIASVSTVSAIIAVGLFYYHRRRRKLEN